MKKILIPLLFWITSVTHAFEGIELGESTCKSYFDLHKAVLQDYDKKNDIFIYYNFSPLPISSVTIQCGRDDKIVAIMLAYAKDQPKARSILENWTIDTYGKPDSTSVDAKGKRDIVWNQKTMSIHLMDQTKENSYTDGFLVFILN